MHERTTCRRPRVVCGACTHGSVTGQTPPAVPSPAHASVSYCARTYRRPVRPGVSLSKVAPSLAREARGATSVTSSVHSMATPWYGL
eukprot:scaffold74056_cov72-Phaeocystis_antarctica.AAC.1